MKILRFAFPLFAALCFGFLSAGAEGIHQYPPRGETAGATKTDTVEYAPGDLLIAAKAQIDTFVRDGTELEPTFSEINSAFSSALSGLSANATGTNISILVDGGSTALHSHAGGGLANSDTTDSLLISKFLKLEHSFIRVEYPFTKEAEGLNSGYAIRAGAVYNGRGFVGVDKGTWGLIYMFDADTSTTWSEFLNPGSGYEAYSMAVFKGKLYVGWGDGANEGDISSYDGTSWTLEYDGSYDQVFDLCVFGDSLYAAMGNGAGEGDVLSSVDGSTWQISHDTIDPTIKALEVWQGKLYCTSSTAATGGYGYLWEFNGATWNVIGNPNATHDIVSMAGYGDKLYLGMGEEANEGDLYYWDGLAFGTPVNTTYEAIHSLIVYGDKLLVGFYDTVDNGDVCVMDGTEWSCSTPLFSNPDDDLTLFLEYNEMLYAGVGGTGTGDADMYEYVNGLKEGTPPPMLGETEQHFAKKVTLQDSLQAAGPVVITGTLHVGWSTGETPEGGGPLAKFSAANSPQNAPVNGAFLWSEKLGAGDYELWAMDSGGNKSSVTRNTQWVPVDMAVSAVRPYVTATENINTDQRTYIAENKLAELIQRWAWETGHLPTDRYVIKHVNRHNPGKLMAVRQGKEFDDRACTITP